MSNEEKATAPQEDSHSSSDVQLVKDESSTSTSSPYMLLPESDTSEMRLVIEGSDDALMVTPDHAEVNIELKPVGSSQCCLLI